MAVDRNAQVRMQAQMKTRQQQAAPNENVTPQEKKIVEDAVQVAGKLLYSDAVSKRVAELVRQAPHVNGIGDAAAQLTSQVDQQMDLPEDLIIPVGLNVAEMVSDLGEELGFYQENTEFVKKAAQFTIRGLYQIYGFDKEGLEAAKGEAGAEAPPTEEAGLLEQGGPAPEPPMEEEAPMEEPAPEETEEVPVGEQ